MGPYLPESPPREYWGTYAFNGSLSPLYCFHQPALQDLKTPADLYASVHTLFNNLFTDKANGFLQTSYGYIYVHDIAAAHATALRNEAATGEKIIISYFRWIRNLAGNTQFHPFTPARPLRLWCPPGRKPRPPK